MDIKPGYKTSEGQGAAIISLIGLLLTAGVISQEDANAALAAVPLLLVLIPFIGYLVSRTMIKTASVAAPSYQEIIGQIDYNETE